MNEESSIKYALIINNSYGDEDLYYLSEFVELVFTSGYEILTTVGQKVEIPNPSTFIGKGMVESIKEYIDEKLKDDPLLQGNLIVCTNFTLTGTQRHNLEKALKVQVVDRNFIILKIFELNAHSVEAKLQVDIASLNWTKNHLINKEGAFSQVTSGGGMHNKGSGEKQLALDKRHIQWAIDARKKELERIRLARKNSRNKRNASEQYKIAVVGYTNSGKSTLINSLIDFAHNKEDKKVLSKNQLFATLETSTRLFHKYGYKSFFITDTVGFVSNLPTTLIDAFRSTLEEVKEADLLIHVVDVSHPKMLDQIKVTNEVLSEIGVKDIPTIYLFNKYDKLKNKITKLPKENEMYCSLLEDDIEDIYRFILEALSKGWKKKEMLIPFSEDFSSFASDNYVTNIKQNKNGYQCTVYLNPRSEYKYSYLLDITEQ